MVDERVQPVRARPLVDEPVAEPGGVVAPVVEPAVVEHEPLHAHPRRPVGDLREPVEVVVEEDGLPDVQHHRLDCRGGRRGSAGRCASARPGRRGRRRRRRSRPRGARTTPRSAARPLRAAGARRRRSWRRCAAVRSTRSTELPLQATWTPTTRPWVVEKPAVPATTMVAASRPGRPPSPSRSHSPSSTVCRCGLRSRSWRPVKSSSSTWSSASGSTTSRPSHDVVARRRCWSPCPAPQRAAGHRLQLVDQAEPGLRVLGARRPAGRRRPPAATARNHVRPPAASGPGGRAGAARVNRPRACSPRSGMPGPLATDDETVGVRRRHAVDARATTPRAARPRRRSGLSRCAGARHERSGTAWDWPPGGSESGRAGRPGSEAARAPCVSRAWPASALDGARRQAADEEPLQRQEHRDRHDAS